jgi:hypothetical protein
MSFTLVKEIPHARGSHPVRRVSLSVFIFPSSFQRRTGTHRLRRTPTAGGTLAAQLAAPPPPAGSTACSQYHRRRQAAPLAPSFIACARHRQTFASLHRCRTRCHCSSGRGRLQLPAMPIATRVAYLCSTVGIACSSSGVHLQLERRPVATPPKSLAASRRRLQHHQYSFVATAVNHCSSNFRPFQLQQGAARQLRLTGLTTCLTAQAPPTCYSDIRRSIVVSSAALLIRAPPPRITVAPGSDGAPRCGGGSACRLGGMVVLGDGR